MISLHSVTRVGAKPFRTSRVSRAVRLLSVHLPHTSVVGRLSTRDWQGSMQSSATRSLLLLTTDYLLLTTYYLLLPTY